MEQTELDLREIFGILRRRLWLLLLLPTVAAVTAGIVSVYVLKPVYSASTTLWVIKEGSSGQVNLNDVMLSRNLTKTYAEVAKSRAVMAGVIDLLKLPDQSIPSLQGKLTVTPVRDTEIISFTVQDEQPVMAARLADAFATVFKTQIRTYMKVENVVVVDLALTPTSPVKPRPLMNVAIALLLGAMVAVGITFLLEYLDTSVKSPEDVARHIGLPVLGVIPVIDSRGEASPRRRHKSHSEHAAVVEK